MTSGLSVERGANLAFVGSVTLIVAFATWLRAPTLTSSLWLDELHTSWSVSGDWAEVAPRAADGNQAPIYFWLVWLVTHIWGQSEVSLRAVSLVASAAFIGSLAWIVRCWTRSAACGIATALLAVFDAHAIFFAREARPYALVQLGALWQSHIYLRRTMRIDPNARICWVLLTCTLFFTHYTSGLLVVGQLVALPLLVRRRQLGAVCRGFFVDLLAVAVVCALALPHLSMIAGRRANWTQFVDQQPITAIWTMFSAGRYLFPTIVLSVGLPLYRRACGHVGNCGWLRLRRIGVLVACWFLVPMLIAWLLIFPTTSPPFNTRFRRHPLLRRFAASDLEFLTASRVESIRSRSDGPAEAVAHAEPGSDLY